MAEPLSDIAIARAVRKAPIAEVAARLGIPEDAVIPYGRDKAKIDPAFVKAAGGRPEGKLILVTAINPTPAGEGKTTTTVGLGDGLNAIGRRACIALREPSLGPCFGQKGGAAGGGYAQVVPMEDINLHFTGDFHAVTTAHNLLAALVDNHLHWGNALARDLGADGAMAALLKDAILPNLVQTVESNPAFVHGGPFANIAHGCNSVAATRLALGLADYVVTEAGFGADLGAEKFFDIKCRQAGLHPDVTVIVATVRALKMNGGVAKTDLAAENVEAVRWGAANLQRHVENCLGFGVPAIVAINHFSTDTAAEVEAVREAAVASGVEAVLCRHWAEGSAGILELAEKVAALADGATARFRPIYPDETSLLGKIEAVVHRIYRGQAVTAEPAVLRALEGFERDGFGHLPVCMAKTQYSFSTDPARLGAPDSHVVHVREVRLAAGAGFVVAICGDILTMPGLPRHPAAERIRLDGEGRVEGLF